MEPWKVGEEVILHDSRRRVVTTVTLAACAARCETVLVQIDKTHTDLAPDWLPALGLLPLARRFVVDIVGLEGD